MTSASNFSRPDQRLKMSALIGLTVSSVLVILLYVSAVLGSGVAATALSTLSMPKFNIFANLIPDDLSQTRGGMELITGVILLQWALIIAIGVYAYRSISRKD